MALQKAAGERNSWIKNYLGTIETDGHLSISTEAFLGAGGDMSIDTGYFWNDASTIAAGGNIILTGGTLNNNSHNLQSFYKQNYMSYEHVKTIRYTRCWWFFGKRCRSWDEYVYDWVPRLLRSRNNWKKTRGSQRSLRRHYLN